jgi:hypothetical protein
MPGRWRRHRHLPRIDPFEVGQPWGRFVQGALQAQARYQRAVSAIAAGPLRERLDDIGRRIEEGVQTCWHVAQEGAALEDLESGLDLAGARRRLAASDAVGPTVVSLQAQVAAGERLAAMVAEAKERLARLEAGLGLAAATAAELSARRATPAEATGLGDDVEHLVAEMSSLRAAQEEVRALQRSPWATYPQPDPDRG